MTDLEGRLRDDAGRRDADEPELLDFDEALDLATDDEKHERTKRSALRWAAAAAAVVVIAGVAADVAWKSPNTGIAVGAKTLRHGGHTYVQQVVAADAASRDKADPATLDIFVLGSDNSDVKCQRLEPAVRLVSQSATVVTIAATVYRVPTTGAYYCGFAGPAYRQIAVRLGRPLGSRTVVNEGDGSAVGVVEVAGVPAPGYLPADYLAGAVERPDLKGQNFAAGRSYTRGLTKLVVDEVPSTQADEQAGAPDSIVSVSGHRGEVRTANARRCVVWPPRPGITRDVCSAGPSILSQAELLKVARSLP